MPIAGEPTGWALLLVGHQWPSLASLSLLTAGSEARTGQRSAHDLYAGALKTIHSGPLAHQEGLTADAIKTLFQRGESHAHHLSTKNQNKSQAYKDAGNAAIHLRNDLRDLAEKGEKKIHDVLASKDPIPVKVSRIVSIVSDYQSQANVTASVQSANVIDAIQRVLDAEELGISARHFAQQQGVSLDGAFNSENSKKLESQVQAMVSDSARPPLAPLDSETDGGELGHRQVQENILARGQVPGNSTDAPGDKLHDLASQAPINNGFQAGSSAPPRGGEFGPEPTSVENAFGRGDLSSVGTTSESATLASAAPSAAPSVNSAAMEVTSSSATGSIGSATSGIATEGAASPPTASISTIADTVAPHTNATTSSTSSPAESAVANFNHGQQAGAPLSSGAEALSRTATSAFHAPLTEVAPVADSAGSAPVSSHPVEVATAPAPVIDSATPISDAAHTVVTPSVTTPLATTVAPAIGPVATPSAAPANLIPYGADLRPPAVAAPAAPAMPAAATPGSAPVSPSGGSSALGQTAVVRQPAGAPTAAASPAGLTESAVAAAASGAAAGSVAAEHHAHDRLTRLLHAVARQEPRLRWIIGEVEDGRTLLTTDLAGGWVPPGIEIPTAVTLLPPAPRSTDLRRLLGPTTLTVSYEPGDYLAPADDGPVATSIRTRDTSPVADLGWELSQATKWRDGLPRLAHTLAKAIISRTGYLDNEVDLLHDHLATLRAQVLNRYPGASATEVGNWQLLATIAALINDESTSANYHFSWFQAQTLARKGGVQG